MELWAGASVGEESPLGELVVAEPGVLPRLHASIEARSTAAAIQWNMFFIFIMFLSFADESIASIRYGFSYLGIKRDKAGK